MKKLFLITFSIFLLLGCSSSISAIREHPVRYNGKSISLHGDVTETISIPLSGTMIFVLYDKTGSIPVFTTQKRTTGDEIKLKARVIAIENSEAIGNVENVAEKITDYLKEANLLQGKIVDLTALGIGRVVKVVLEKTQGSYFLIEE